MHADECDRPGGRVRAIRRRVCFTAAILPGEVALAMAIWFTALEPEHLSAVRRLGLRLCDAGVWSRPRAEAFYRWRYLGLAGHRAWLALRDDECLALIGAFPRTYRFGAEERSCYELCDWACLPELRASGLGIHVLRHLTDEGTPIVALDGTLDTVRLLPRVGFRPFATAVSFLLPLAAGFPSGRLASLPWPVARLARAAFDLGLGRVAFELGPRHWFRPRRRSVPRGGRVLPVASVGEEIDALYAGPTSYGTLPLVSRSHLGWLASRHPGVGHFVPLYFAVGETLVGFALLRVFEAAAQIEATLVEAFAPSGDAGVYTWMVSEAGACAAGFGAASVRAQTTCPAFAAALRANHYLAGPEAPVLLWSKDDLAPSAPVHIGLDNADNPLLPYARECPTAAGAT